MNRFKSGLLALSIWAAHLIPGFPVARAQREISLQTGWTVQSSAKVRDAPEKISSPGYDASDWYKASAPETVFAVLVENGIYKNPYFGMNLRSVPGVDYPVGSQFANLEMPANSPYAVPWWYRDEFELPSGFKGKNVWIGFHGINYRADLWINGKKVAGSDEMVGAFRRFTLNVTPFVRPGERNVVALSVSAPRAGELAITFVDWNPMSPDKEMGLWQDVALRARGPVAVRYASVDSHLDLSGALKAQLTVRSELQNSSASPLKGELRGKITGAANPIEFSQPVELAANETRDVAVTPENTPALDLENPRLWWPYQMGEPYLHQLSLEFVPEHGVVSDEQSFAFGIVEADSELTPEGYRLFKVNGKPVLVRGAGWTSDMMLRIDQSRREAEFRYVKEMGMNTIRLEGKLEDDSFFERADRDGILVMAGWCCCDSWEKWGKWSEENKRVSVESLRDQMLRLRRHPSVLVWLNGSDNPPPGEREQAYLDVEKATFWPKPVISSATAKKSEASGPSGVKMTGP